MNYFELYPGDYLRDTTRLTLVEHGAYLRLLMAYYAEEAPLPADCDELFTIAGATKSSEKDAVKRVADRFFPVGSDGLRHNARADDEIAKASERIEASAERRSNDAERQRRARERRKSLFQQLRDVGITPSFNATTAELESLVARHVTPTRHVTDGVTGDVTDDVTRLNVTRDNTATTRHTPHASKALATPSQAQNHLASATPAGRACLLMREAGCIQTNPQHPDLLAALGAGVTPEQLGQVAAEAIAKRKADPFTWAVSTASQRRTAGEPITEDQRHADRSHGRRESATDRSERLAREADARDAAARAHS